MASYKLNDAAKDDIARIYRHGVVEYGEVRADAYYFALFQRFDRIAEHPLTYPAMDHIRAGYRRSVCGVHSIYYRFIGGYVEIMRVIGRQDFSDSP